MDPRSMEVIFGLLSENKNTNIIAFFDTRDRLLLGFSFICMKATLKVSLLLSLMKPEIEYWMANKGGFADTGRKDRNFICVINAMLKISV